MVVSWSQLRQPLRGADVTLSRCPSRGSLQPLNTILCCVALGCCGVPGGALVVAARQEVPPADSGVYRYTMSKQSSVAHAGTL